MRCQLRGVRSQAVTTTSEKRFGKLGRLLNHDRFPTHPVLPEEIRCIHLCCCSWKHTYRGTLQFLGALEAQFLWYQEPLSVIIVHMRKVKTVHGFASQGLCGIPTQDIDLFRLKRRQALDSCQRREFHLLGIAKYRGGDGKFL